MGTASAVPTSESPTPDRLLAAATALFASQGFHGTSIRDIAERANANVASGHYHYGSKEGLYVEVLRAHFKEIRTRLATPGVRMTRSALQRTSRRQLVQLLETRIRTVLDVMLSPPATPYGALYQREMVDPTIALPIIVDEFIRPQTEEMEALLAALAPHLGREALQLTTFSVFGQVLFYRFNMPAILLLLNRASYPRGFNRKIARHIAHLSLAGIADRQQGRRARAT